jgi:hypothetical protein
MSKQQTAVEWLAIEIFNQIELLKSSIINSEEFRSGIIKKRDKAIEMEKQQTLDFTRNAVRKILDEDRQNPFNLEQYYDQTFKSE